MHSIVIPDDPPTGGLEYDLTTVDAVNAALGTDGDTASDAITGDKITANSKLIAEICHRVFALRGVTETFRLHQEYAHGLVLREYPVRTISSVSVSGVALASTEYKFDPDSGILWRWTTNMGCCGWRCGEVAVAYTAGYDLPSEAPAALAQACISMIAESGSQAGIAAAGGGGIRDIQHGDRRVSYFQPTTSSANSFVSSAVFDLIQPFKRVVLA